MSEFTKERLANMIADLLVETTELNRGEHEGVVISVEVVDTDDPSQPSVVAVEMRDGTSCFVEVDYT